MERVDDGMLVREVLRLRAELDGLRAERAEVASQHQLQLTNMRDRIDTLEQGAAQWRRMVNGPDDVDLIGGRTFHDYKTFVREAIGAAAGNEVAESMVALAIVAGMDRQDLRDRVEQMEAQGAELAHLIQSAARSIAALFGMVDDRLVHPTDRVSPNIVEAGICVDRIDHRGNGAGGHVPEVHG